MWVLAEVNAGFVQGSMRLTPTVCMASTWQANTFNLKSAPACRVRKQKELEELCQRMHSLERDNQSLRGHVDSRNTEISRLRSIIQDMHDTGGNGPPAQSPPSEAHGPAEVHSQSPCSYCILQQRTPLPFTMLQSNCLSGPTAGMGMH